MRSFDECYNGFEGCMALYGVGALEEKKYASFSAQGGTNTKFM